jgi:hypothetical protein
VSDDLLQSIDDDFAMRTAVRLRRGGRQQGSDRAASASHPDHAPAAAGAAAGAAAAAAAIGAANPHLPATWAPRFEASAGRQPATIRSVVRLLGDKIEPIEIFIAIQFLWGILVFIPGAQQYRALVRALPYASSLGMLALYTTQRSRESLPRSAALLVGALLLLVVNLLQPSSQLNAGVAQCVFQLSIAAPLFWAHKAVRSALRLERLIVLVFVLNAASAAVGVLQVYFPEQFMPAEFNSLGLRLNQYYLDGLTYEGADGRSIIRPPGLTDQPGAAASAGALTAILGLGLLLRRRRPLQVAAILAAVTLGFASIYFSQVRSLLLATIGASAVLSVVALRRGRLVGASRTLFAGAVIVVASFAWATTTGGEAVSDRFETLQGTGAIDAYREGRGSFVAETTGELLDKYPLGAGVGRWGMMNTYFGNPFNSLAEPIYVEIQLTGWLLDGGVLMWMLYGGATLLSLWAAFRCSGAREPQLAEAAIIVLGAQAYVLALTLAAPVFNSQLGILFWTLAGALHGAGAREVKS